MGPQGLVLERGHHNSFMDKAKARLCGLLARRRHREAND